MTDEEINLAIARIEYPDYPVVNARHGGKIICAAVEHLLDYCNNWEDIGPIIEREKIKLFSSEGVDWKATLVKRHSELTYGVWSEHAETPTRAAALCFVSYLYSKYDSF